MTDPRFPIGRFAMRGPLAPVERAARAAVLASTPARLRAALRRVDRAALDRPHRAGGWTVRQVVHHLADSHMHGFLRCKLALTEAEPALRGYAGARWAELPDARTAPVEPSLTLLEALHARWTVLLASLAPDDFARGAWLPTLGRCTLDDVIALYAWHSEHHVAQIGAAGQRQG